MGGSKAILIGLSSGGSERNEIPKSLINRPQAQEEIGLKILLLRTGLYGVCQGCSTFSPLTFPNKHQQLQGLVVICMGLPFTTALSGRPQDCIMLSISHRQCDSYLGNCQYSTNPRGKKNEEDRCFQLANS